MSIKMSEVIIEFINNTNNIDDIVDLIDNYHELTHRIGSFVFFDDYDFDKYTLQFVLTQRKDLIQYAASFGIHRTFEEIQVMLNENINNKKWKSIQNSCSNVMSQQNTFFRSQSTESYGIPGEEVIYIGCKIHGVIYGGTFMFIYGDYAFIEATTKYPIPLTFHFLFPEVTTLKLNDILMSEIESIARENNIMTLYRASLDKQRSLMIDQYGFVAVDKDDVPDRNKLVGRMLALIKKEL